jgi:3-hydroxyisobutyrate dehydrogenase-like beta-hydroxyacid dehydrogenase
MIGVGRMGHGIAASLIRKGHLPVLLAHPGNQPIDDLLASGARTVASVGALACEVDLVILCVTGTPEVEAVVLGEGGLLANLAPGTTVIDCSTALPESTVRVARAVSDAGGRFMDAAMTRTPKEAAEGRLNLLVGGDVALLEACRPVLACFAENILHAGPVGAGHRLKLLHNYVSLGQVALLAEAAACAARTGVDTRAFVDALAIGGGWGAALERLKPWLLEGSAANLQFSLSNARKDLGYYNRMADEAGVDRRVAAAVESTVVEACAQGDPEALVPELVERIRDRPPSRAQPGGA